MFSKAEEWCGIDLEFITIFYITKRE